MNLSETDPETDYDNSDKNYDNSDKNYDSTGYELAYILDETDNILTDTDNGDILTSEGLLVGSVEDIAELIRRERIGDLRSMYREISEVTEISRHISGMVGHQGEQIEKAYEVVQNTDTNVHEAKEELQQGESLSKNRFKMLRDAAIMIGGGILGLPGLIFGPIVGIGTIAAGASAGGAIVYGIHKKFDSKS